MGRLQPQVVLWSEKPDGSHKSIGTWDGQTVFNAWIKRYVTRTQFASLVHDVLYQFRNGTSTGGVLASDIYTRKDADEIFRTILKSTGHGWYLGRFKLKSLHNEYYLAVRLFGGGWAKIAERWTNRDKVKPHDYILN